MKLLDRHIAKTVLSAIILMIFLLASLQLFILIVDQMNDIGQGDYHVKQAIQFVLLQTPYQIYLFFPMICLLGALIGLGILGNNRELVVMRAAGMSVIQIGLSVLKAALILILIASILGETVFPRWVNQSNDHRMQAINSGQALKTTQGIWLRDHNDFISIEHILPEKTLENIFQYRLNQNHQLYLVRHIDSMRYINKKWYAHHIEETQFHNTSTSTKIYNNQIFDLKIEPSVLGLGLNEPEEMTLWELYKYINYMKKNKNSATRYELAFWQRAFWPFTAIVMILLAIPFIFGPLRSTPMGAKLLAGAATGFSFFIINRFFGPLSQVFNWPPLLTAIIPTVLFACLGLFMMKRVR